MLELRSDSLVVSVLDPVADLDKMVDPATKAWRYNTGGYIWQVTDRLAGELLSGPSRPAEVGSGQGIPDSFQWRPVRPLGVNDGPAMIIGLGEVESADGAVTSTCDWRTERVGDNQLVFRTAQSSGSFELELERSVTLSGRNLRSHTRLKNLGSELPFTWCSSPRGHQPTARVPRSLLARN